MPSAIIVVDMQNDFVLEDGALSVPRAEEIIPVINDLLPLYDYAVFTRDWHPEDHPSFEANGGIWPVHCVENTPGARLHSDLDLTRVRNGVPRFFNKGQDYDSSGYSAFDRSDLAPLLRHWKVTSLLVTGVATDFCVRATVLDALAEDFEVAVSVAAVRGITDLGEEDALDEMAAAGAEITV